jgi:hypothetical protein
MHGAIGKTSEDEMLLEEKCWLHQQTATRAKNFEIQKFPIFREKNEKMPKKSFSII